jgi:hypothetical protein
LTYSGGTVELLTGGTVELLTGGTVELSTGGTVPLFSPEVKFPTLEVSVVFSVAVFFSAQPAAKTTVAITRSIAIIFNIFFIDNTSKVLFLFYTQLIQNYEIFI